MWSDPLPRWEPKEAKVDWGENWCGTHLWSHLFTVLSPHPQGRFTIAAKHHISIAEIYETELVDVEKVSWYQAGCA